MQSNTSRILFNLFLKTDYRDKEKTAYKKLTGIFISYLFANSFIGWSNYMRFDEYSFIILAFSINIFFITFVSLTEYADLFFSKRQMDIFTSLPLIDAEIFKAKLKSATAYISFFGISLIIPQSVFVYLYSHDILRTLMFAILCFAFTLSILYLILLVQTFVILISKKQSGYLQYILQFFFIFFIIYTSTLSSKAGLENKGSIKNYDIVQYLPQNLYYLGIDNYAYFALSFLISFLIFLLFYYILKFNYSTIYKFLTITDKPKKSRSNFSLIPLNNFISSRLLKNNVERASYDLMKYQFINSRSLKVKYIPTLFLPIIFAVIAVTSNTPGFLTLKSAAFSNMTQVVAILGPTITMMIIMSSRLMISSTKISDEHSAGTDWLYKSIPVKENVWIFSGVNKFIYINLITPMLLIVFFILLIRLDIQTIGLNMLFIVSCLIFINSVFSLFDKTFPFTLESSKFNSTSKFLEVLLTMLIGIVIFVGQIFIFQNVIFVVAAIAVMLIVSVLINRN
jgi:hypothetical protein